MSSLLYCVLFIFSAQAEQTTRADPQQSLVLEGAIHTEDIENVESKLLQSRKTCGPISLWFCLRSHGCDQSVKDVMGNLPVNEQGVNLLELAQYSSRQGIHAEIVSINQKNVDLLPYPAILVLGTHHVAVFAGPHEDKILIFEPSRLSFFAVTKQELSSYWTGEAIVFDSVRPTSVQMVGVFAVACGSTMALLLLKRYRKRSSSNKVVEVSTFG